MSIKKNKKLITNQGRFEGNKSYKKIRTKNFFKVDFNRKTKKNFKIKKKFAKTTKRLLQPAQTNK